MERGWYHLDKRLIEDSEILRTITDQRRYAITTTDKEGALSPKKQLKLGKL
jgi:hypothetical protein